MGKEFTQEHPMKICLPPELHLVVAKFQVQKEIGKYYAGLLLLTKAAYQEQLITKETYEKYLYRYSRKLVPEEQPQKMSFWATEGKTEIRRERHNIRYAF